MTRRFLGIYFQRLLSFWIWVVSLYQSAWSKISWIETIHPYQNKGFALIVWKERQLTLSEVALFMTEIFYLWYQTLVCKFLLWSRPPQNDFIALCLTSRPEYLYSYLDVTVKLCKMAFAPGAGEGFYRATPAVIWDFLGRPILSPVP